MICRKCKQNKSDVEFTFRNDSFKYRTECKQCKSYYDKKYRIKNRNRIKSLVKIRYKKNRSVIKSKSSKYYIKNKKRVLVRQKQYYLKNKLKIKNYIKRWRKNNKIKRNKQESLRRKVDIKFKLRSYMSNAINNKLRKRLLNKNTLSILKFVPYTIDDLIKHLESKFQLGMTWENYGKYGWHIDHVIPDCRFNYKSVEDEEFQRCWTLKNLQPLWAKDNLSKQR